MAGHATGFAAARQCSRFLLLFLFSSSCSSYYFYTQVVKITGVKTFLTIVTFIFITIINIISTVE